MADAPASSATQGLTGDPNLDPLTVLDSTQVPYRLKLDQSVLLAVINAREFQDRREDVYNAALDVSLNRFSFAAQGFFTEQAMRQSIGSQLAGGGQFWNLNTTTGVSRLFPTGRSSWAQLANQVVVDLGNGKPALAISNLSLSLMQPFLSGGGYAVTLEPLTESERTNGTRPAPSSGSANCSTSPSRPVAPTGTPTTRTDSRACRSTSGAASVAT